MQGCPAALLSPLAPSVGRQYYGSSVATTDSDDSFMGIPQLTGHFARLDMKTTAHALETTSDTGVGIIGFQGDCLPPDGCCLLPAACCLLPAACCLLPAACCLLPAACCLLPCSGFWDY